MQNANTFDRFKIVVKLWLDPLMKLKTQMCLKETSLPNYFSDLNFKL